MNNFLFRKKGISVIVSCQDDHKTLRGCVESFLEFGDEIIVVTNNATQETISSAKKLEADYQPKVKYIDAKYAKDLYQNRQAGLEKSSYRWVMRCDADYIAYTDEDGKRSISKLREKILSLKPWWPTAIYISKICISMGWDKMYEIQEGEKDVLKYIPSVNSMGKLEARLYSYNPWLKFTRLGRWEGVPGIRWYKKVRIDDIYWFEVTLRSAKSLLYRKARTDWREVGDYDRFPSLDAYIDQVYLPSEYPGKTVEQASDAYMEEVMKKISDYDEAKYLPLPLRIRRKAQVKL